MLQPNNRNFAATEFNEIFSGRHQRQDVNKIRELPPLPSSGCAGGLVGPSVLVLPNHQHTLKMGTEVVPATAEKLHLLTLLSARENFIGDCVCVCCALRTESLNLI